MAGKSFWDTLYDVLSSARSQGSSFTKKKIIDEDIYYEKIGPKTKLWGTCICIFRNSLKREPMRTR